MKSLFRLLVASMLLSSLFGGNANAAVTSVVLDSNQSLSVNLGKFTSVWLSVTVVDGAFKQIFSQTSSVGSLLGSLPGSSTTAGILGTLFKNGSFTLAPTAGTTASVSIYGITGSYSTNLKTLAAVPEPETYALIAFGIAGLLLNRRRRNNAQADLATAA